MPIRLLVLPCFCLNVLPYQFINAVRGHVLMPTRLSILPGFLTHCFTISIHAVRRHVLMPTRLSILPGFLTHCFTIFIHAVRGHVLMPTRGRR
jgi:hypothetical protein